MIISLVNFQWSAKKAQNFRKSQRVSSTTTSKQAHPPHCTMEQGARSTLLNDNVSVHRHLQHKRHLVILSFLNYVDKGY